jgi:DME family drug/metabolite transporter
MPEPEAAGATIRHRLMLLAAATLFSTGGAAIKAASVSSWQVASFRSAVASVTLLLLFPAARKLGNWRLWPVGLAYSGTLVLFVLSTRLTTAANAIFLQSTAPLYLLALAPLLLHEHIRRSDLLFLAAIGAGMALVLLGDTSPAATAPNPALGDRFGAAAGLAWAFTVAGLRWLGRHSTGNAAIPAVAAGNLIAFLSCLPMALPMASIGTADLLVLLYLGVVQIGLAYFFVTRALRHVPAFEATALLLLEPALNPVWTWLVHHERPGARAIAGGLVILSATLVQTWSKSRLSSAKIIQKG